jgi:hypothetical protein
MGPDQVFSRVAHRKLPVLRAIFRLADAVYKDPAYLGMRKSKTADALAKLVFALQSITRIGGASDDVYEGLSILSEDAIQPLLAGLRRSKHAPPGAIAKVTELNQLYQKYKEDP